MAFMGVFLYISELKINTVTPSLASAVAASNSVTTKDGILLLLLPKYHVHHVTDQEVLPLHSDGQKAQVLHNLQERTKAKLGLLLS